MNRENYDIFDKFIRFYRFCAFQLELLLLKKCLIQRVVRSCSFSFFLANLNGSGRLVFAE